MFSSLHQSNVPLDIQEVDKSVAVVSYTPPDIAVSSACFYVDNTMASAADNKKVQFIYISASYWDLDIL